LPLPYQALVNFMHCHIFQRHKIKCGRKKCGALFFQRFQFKTMRTIRAIHPLTQQQLSEYLLVSRNQVAHYELGRRSLPAKASIKLSRLEIALAKNDHTLTTTAELAMRELLEEEAIRLDHQLTSLKISWFAASKKIKEARAKYKKAMELLWAIPVLLQQLSPGKEGEFEKKWLQATEFTLLKEMKHYGLAKQEVLELRQATLQRQIKDIEALITKFNKKGKRKKVSGEA